MTHYIDIKVLETPEFSRFAVLNALFEGFHKALVDTGRDDVGVSFPGLETKTLDFGSVMRMHGKPESLEQVLQNRNMRRIQDYVSVSAVKTVPLDAKYRKVSRVQSKSSPERLRRRLAKRKGITMEEAARQIPDTSAQFVDLPFVTLASSSTKQKFRLFIRHGELSSARSSGQFNCYGLSSEASVPWF